MLLYGRMVECISHLTSVVICAVNSTQNKLYTGSVHDRSRRYRLLYFWPLDKHKAAHGLRVLP